MTKMKIKLTLIAMTLILAGVAHGAEFAVSSSDIVEGKMLTSQQVFQGFGCAGDNRSPQLTWRGAPSGTKSYAITVYDPDAPTGSGWWHWTLVNLPPSTTSLPAGAGGPAGALPAGARQGRSDYGQFGFGGACPPAGDKAHRYQFTVWALKVDQLPIDEQSSGALVGYMLNANVLAKATMTALYGR
jgi:Raf kinase inhibitor-like YbhB/YbcL family protein